MTLLEPLPQTAGERRVAALLQKLPEKQYYSVDQPCVIDHQGQSWRPDFVVIDARHGVAVLEVKDWSQVVEANQQHIHIRKRDGVILKLDNPDRTAYNYATRLAQRFQDRQELLHLHRGIQKLNFPWQHALVFPNLPQDVIDQIEAAGIWARGLAISCDSLQTEETFARALHRLPWRFKLDGRMDNDILDAIRGVVNPSVVILDPDGQDAGTETRTQADLIREPLPPPQLAGMADPDAMHIRLVRGVAGSGKTLVLIRRAQYLNETYPDLRIAVMSFNRDLADDLKAHIDNEAIDVLGFHQMCIKAMDEQHKINSAHWMLKRIASKTAEENELAFDFVVDEIKWRKDTELYDNDEYLRIARTGRGSRLAQSKREVINAIFDDYRQYQQRQRDRGKDWMDWEDVPPLALEALARADHPLRDYYDVILIDEAQDFAPIWFKVVRMLLKPGGSLFIADDPTQSLFRLYSWKQKGVEVVGHSTLLRTPFRNTRQISIAAHVLIQSDATLKDNDDILTPALKSYDLLEGPPPALVGCLDTETEANHIEKQIVDLLAAGQSGKSIAILCHGTKDVEAWEHLRDQQVYVNTFGKMKGLEFDVVFIPRLDSLFIRPEDDDDPDFDTDQRRRLFTAITRAKQAVVMSYVGDLPAQLEVLEPYVTHTQL